jgi:hypothetical protein
LGWSRSEVCVVADLVAMYVRKISQDGQLRSDHDKRWDSFAWRTRARVKQMHR